MRKLAVSLGLIILGFSGAYAGHERPLVTESAEITLYGSIEIREGIDYLKNITLLFQPRDKDWDVIKLPEMGVAVGLGDRIEVQADFDLLYHHTATDDSFDVGDLRFWTKVKLFKETEMRPAVAIKFGTKLPNADNSRSFGTDESDNYGILILSKNIMGFDSRFNLGMGILGNPNEVSTQDDVLVYGLGVVRPICGDIKAVAEVTGIANSHNGNDRSTLQAGIQIPRQWLTWDIAVSKGLNKSSEDWGLTAGATFTFQAFGK
jgi:hypothetical protein